MIQTNTVHVPILCQKEPDTIDVIEKTGTNGTIEGFENKRYWGNQMQ